MPGKKNKIQLSATPLKFPVIGVGASAGGLDAFKRLLKAIPEDSGMAYVLVQHLDPTHESILPEILSRSTRIPVYEIKEDTHLAPDHIYVIPANKTLTSTAGVLKLTKRDVTIKNLPIDVFFTSLAEVHQNLAVGVVLSGTASDGTLGLKAIKDHGGITFAQDQESAAYGSMPQNAVNAGAVDFILPPEKIPEQLLQISRAYKTNHVFKEESDLLSKDDENVFKQIISLLNQRSGVDFTYYKQNTIRRRIARRMAIGKTEKLSDYLKSLRHDKAEQDAMFQDMLIPVTSFFRDPKTFETLCDVVFPLLFKNKSAGEPIRVWVAGCSTGEEAYSLAICLHECLGDKSSYTRIQIFASDISETSIKKARTGIYSNADVATVSEARLEKYFTKNNGGYEIGKYIRDMCVFAPHNFLKDPPFAKMDLISCRNVLIYMDTFLQKKALITFHYALKENGFLLLGKSETTSTAPELFTLFTKHDKIYSRKSVSGRFMYAPAEQRKEEPALKKLPAVNAAKSASKQEDKHSDFRKIAESILLSSYTPAGVIVNDQMDIVHIHGTITPFLEPSPGKPTFNLIKMAREGLAFELRNALHKAKDSQAAVIREGIPLKINGKQSLATIEIIPLTTSIEPHFLILFNQTPSQITPSLSSKAGVKSTEYEESQLRIQQLERELAQIRDDMRSITEDQEAANEELQSANEELQSSNEEMQSLNEELETSKEELQSTNEELIIVNQELLDKQEELNAARFFAESIVATIREPLVVLDKSLRIKTANASFYKKFGLGKLETEGKLFYELQGHQWDDNVLRSLLLKILPGRERLADFEIVLKFPSMGERIMLINALQIANERPAHELILLAIEDITEQRLAEQKLKNFNTELEAKIIERTADLLQTNNQLEQFAHAASHDLQEPLRKIVTFTNILKDKHEDEFSENAQDLIKKISGASERMILLIKNLLEYSYLLNHEKLFVRTDLNEIVKNVFKDLELLIEQKKAEIKIDTLPVISAIPFQINQLFYNLLNNAFKFAKEDVAPIISITARTPSVKEIKQHADLNPQLAYTEITIKDSGIGFEQKYNNQIFDLFQRLNTQNQYPGTGIGLALSKKIVEIHHGVIFAESKENEGAAFHVILPMKQSP